MHGNKLNLTDKQKFDLSIVYGITVSPEQLFQCIFGFYDLIPNKDGISIFTDVKFLEEFYECINIDILINTFASIQPYNDKKIPTKNEEKFKEAVRWLIHHTDDNHIYYMCTRLNLAEIINKDNFKKLYNGLVHGSNHTVYYHPNREFSKNFNYELLDENSRATRYDVSNFLFKNNIYLVNQYIMQCERKTNGNDKERNSD
jgi:hypothetical protein